MSLKYGSSQSKYCYPDTDILINKLDIQNEELLKEAELLYTTQRLLELEASPVLGSFDMRHLKKIHHHIFQDIYPFAGKTRDEDISKGNTLFAHWQYIDENGIQIFNKLKTENFLVDLSTQHFSMKAAYYMSELNVLHPFREGNGRAIREIIRSLAVNCDYVLNWNVVDKDLLLQASIKSVYDITTLSDCIKKAIES